MLELQHGCMQQQPFGAISGRISGIERVAEDRMTDESQMHAQLMGASGFRLQQQTRRILQIAL